MLNFGLLFMITLVLLAAYKLPSSHPEIFAQSRWKFNPRLVSGTALSAAIINIVFMLLLAYALKWTFLIFVAAAIAGVVLYYVRIRQIGFVPKGFQLEPTEQQKS
jgi:hypothetical protein